MRYSATSVMLPDLTLVEQAALLQRLGYDGIEWRVRRVGERGKGFSNWGEHKNDLTPENFAEKAPEMKQVAADHGLAIAGLASAAPATDLEQVKLLVDGAAKCGAAFVRVGASRGYGYGEAINYHVVYDETVAAYGKAVEAAAGSGVKLALEIHGHTIHCSASLAYRILSHFTPEQVCAIYDPQNMVSDGYETTELGLELLDKYVGHCHVGGHKPVEKGKDATGTSEWDWPGCPMADGLYDYRRMLRKLKAMDYPYFLSIEDFRDLPAEEKLREGIAYLKKVEAAV
jgi:sugar phosphate isomerase/epimerase